MGHLTFSCTKSLLFLWPFPIYLNTDTGELIRITRKGAEKVTRHDAENIAHLKSIALIPQLIMHSFLF